MTITPVRLRLSRARGFDLQTASRAANGLAAINCARPGKWGNPFPWRGDWIVWAAVAGGFRADEAGRKAAAVAYHRAWLIDIMPRGPLAESKSIDEIVFANGGPVNVAEHARCLAAGFAQMNGIDVPARPKLREIRTELCSHNLACWCAPGAPCHADTLLELANP